eukprot:gene8879-9057_t
MDLENFEDQWERSLNNTGGRRKGKRTRSDKDACLYECTTGDDSVDTLFSTYVAHLAGSPDVYFSTNPADVRAGVNLVSAVRDQGRCGTCVSHVIASAAESAAAAAQRVDARLFNISLSHSFAYYCAELGGRRSCGTGWSFADALQGMKDSPLAYIIHNSCTSGVDPSRSSLTDAQLKQFCVQSVASSACQTPAFECHYKTLSDGIAQVQLYIRAYGAVMTRLKVTPSFKQFFTENPAGVFNGTSSVSPSIKENGFWHAVLLVGYNNSGMFWYAKNSWGDKWGDNGFFRIKYGVADVAFPEDTYSLVDCSTNNKQPDALAAWLDRWPVTRDPEDDSCWLYTATAEDTISGMADHFQVNILEFIQDNTRRGVIPTETLGDPPRPPEDPCSNPNYCNGRAASCAVGRCNCTLRYEGKHCEIDTGGGYHSVTLRGENYRLYVDPPLSWPEARRFCRQIGMRLARSYSREHAHQLNEALPLPDIGLYWNGLNDRRQEGAYVWDVNDDRDEGVALDFSFWSWSPW